MPETSQEYADRMNSPDRFNGKVIPSDGFFFAAGGMLDFYALPGGSLQQDHEEQRPKKQKPKRRRVYWPRRLAC
jgi:hypothetical protein